MNIAGVTVGTSGTVAVTGNQTKDAAAVAVLRQTLDMQKETAAQLIEVVSESARPTSSNSRLGGHVDTFA
ncbi:MAG: putative motility protein [Gammaproteobacteria bacterium]|nr:putative motility protein [Gammaproteobacteria bacterium]